MLKLVGSPKTQMQLKTTTVQILSWPSWTCIELLSKPLGCLQSNKTGPTDSLKILKKSPWEKQNKIISKTYLPSPASSRRTKTTSAVWGLTSLWITQEATFRNSSNSTPMFSTSRKKSPLSSSVPLARTRKKFLKDWKEIPLAFFGQILSTLLSIFAFWLGGIFVLFNRKRQNAPSEIVPEPSLSNSLNSSSIISSSKSFCNFLNSSLEIYLSLSFPKR